MFCPNCGTRITQGVTVCATCGTDLSAHLAQVPPPPPPPPPPGSTMARAGSQAMMPPPPPMGVSDKSRMAAGLLQIFLGGLGAGRFYLGHTGIAIAQIAACVLTCGIGWVWPLIDGILMLAGKVNDAQGRPLRD
ncbi:MAG TPA: TM2 domain-containing protein [Myxococcaceae bacterium]|nr:TM2 domain-containing protein [Myxococcaceae bacterium]